MPNKDLHQLKALALAATRGPWMRLFGERTVYDRMEDGCRGNAIVRADGWGAQDAANLDFVAVANPVTILAMIERDAALVKALQWIVDNPRAHPNNVRSVALAALKPKT